MTLVISVTSKNGSWLAADRRYGHPVAESHLGTKLCRLDTTNSYGHITYFGIGAYVRDHTPPLELSTWISKALRGRKMNHNQTLSVLFSLAKDHKIGSVKLNQPHMFQWVGFVDGTPTVDSLGTHSWMREKNLRTGHTTTSDIGQADYAIDRRQSNDTLLARGGSGAQHLKEIEVNRLIKLSKQAKRSSIHARRVCSYLSYLIRTASSREGNKTVSPESLVSAVLPDGGGWHQEFNAIGKPTTSEIIPALSSGVPVSEILESIRPIFEEWGTQTSRAWNEGREPPEMNDDEIVRAISRINDKPDDTI